MSAISNQQSVASSEFPQVYYVRIPNPDCKEVLPQCNPLCQDTLIPIDDGKVGNALWAFDKDHNHILDANDVVGDIAATIPGGAAHRLAELVVGSQYSANSKSAFKSIDDFLNVVRTTQAVDQAYETVQWLNTLPSKQINSGFLSNEIEYNTDDWKKIVGRLGGAGIGYSTQVNQASRLFQETLSKVPGVQSKAFVYTTCGRESCTTHGSAFFIDPTAAPYGLRGLMTDWSHKMAAIYDFALNMEIECAGWGCPSQSESPQPYETVKQRGLLIGLRQNQGTDTKQSYLAFDTHFERSDPQAMWADLDEWLVEKRQGNMAAIAAK